MFCENCGTKLSNDARFCENCGFKISYDDDFSYDVDSLKDGAEFLTIFETENWKNTCKKYIGDTQESDIGIILFNTSGCESGTVSEFRKKLIRYVIFCKRKGIRYYALDMATQMVKPNANGFELKSVIDVLSQVHNYAKPKYLLIVGDRNSTPSAKWENRAGDWDEFVDSDLCYISLDLTSPFENSKKNCYFSVGRIPASAKNGFVEACEYFDSVIKKHKANNEIRSMALSAEEWTNVSKINFEHSCNAVYPCPPNSFLPQASVTNVEDSNHYNLLCFNLHGSSTNDFWLSGGGTFGYSPECLPNGENLYVLCSEACYGAKPVVREGAKQSILVSAIKRGCVAFCGSTQIAYGIPDSVLQMGGHPCAADVLIGKFAQHVSEGYTVGQAYLKGLAALSDSAILQAEDIKTMASFALYGDPSLTFVQGVGAKPEGFAKIIGPKSLAFPDVRLAVNKRIYDVSQKISSSVEKCLNTHFKSFIGVMPEYYELSHGKGYKVAFKKNVLSESEFLNIYVDKGGDVQKIYVSK